ncbi:MAG: AAA family ATPase [Gaiellaceae bacterium]
MNTELGNPFRYGDVARGPFFTDRETELSALVADIRSGQNVVIISPRRHGKTSLVLRAVERLRRQKVLVAYLDLFRSPSKERLADHLAEAIHDGLVAPVERAVRKAAAVFAQLPVAPRLTITETGRPALEFTTFERSEDVDRTLEALLELPQQIATERGRRVAVIFDEFQEILSIDPDLPGLMRASFQQQSEVAHVFLGSRRHLMEQLFTSDKAAHLYRSAKPLPLGPIPRDDFAAFIRSRFDATAQRIEAEAVERILDLTDGHPYDTQELCYFTWARANAARVSAGPALVDEALDEVLKADSSRFTTLWERLSSHQRLVLTALARETGPVFSEAYRRRHKLGSSSTVAYSLERLADQELVDSQEGRYRLPDVFLRAWVARLAASSDR